jgi:hypothetical protein
MSNDHDHTIKTTTITINGRGTTETTTKRPKTGRPDRHDQNDQTTIKTISTTKNVPQDRLAPLPTPGRISFKC